MRPNSTGPPSSGPPRNRNTFPVRYFPDNQIPRTRFQQLTALLLTAVVIGFLGFALLTLAVPIRKAFGHSFYDAACCSDNDCALVEQVEPTATGEWWTTAHGRVFVPNDFKPRRVAPDMRMHACMTAGPKDR